MSRHARTRTHISSVYAIGALAARSRRRAACAALLACLALTLTPTASAAPLPGHAAALPVITGDHNLDGAERVALGVLSRD